MKKFFLSLLTFCAFTASAQSEIVVGDMNADGQLTVGDVTALSETVIGKAPRRTISTKCAPNVSDPSAIAGSWCALDKSIFELTAEGKATVSGNSAVKAECVIVVEKPHEYVDLGLPSGTLWATTNVGASEPEDYGYYFAWGEVEPKSTYNRITYFDRNYEKYNNNGGKTELDLEDDAAYMNWGEGWRMPSLKQIEELYNGNYVKREWVTQNGKSGRLITSKTNGASLFLPAAGYRDEGSLIEDGSWGYYWSRSLNASNNYLAQRLYFDSSNNVWCCGDDRYYGFPVRPVRVSSQN